MAAECGGPLRSRFDLVGHNKARVDVEELLKEQQEAILDVLETWLESQEERLSRHLTSVLAELPARQPPRICRPSMVGPRRISRVSRQSSKESKASLPSALKHDAMSESDDSNVLAMKLPTEPPPEKVPTSENDGDATANDRHSARRFSRMQRVRSPAAVDLSERMKKRGEGPESTVCFQIVVHGAFEPFFGILICFNAILTAMEVQSNLDSPKGDSPAWFGIIGHSLGICFLVELLLRLAAFGRGFLMGPQVGWNYFDLFLVTSWSIEFAMDVLQGLTGSDASTDSGLSNMRLFRILRITRMFRLLRVSRLLRFVRALNLLILSILTTLRSLVWASGLLLLIIFTFAIFICQSVADYVGECARNDCNMDPDLTTYWGSLPIACLSLFQMITGGQDWDVMARPLMEISLMLLLILIIFIIFTQFAVLNVVTGVFCQAAVEGAQRDRELMVQSMLNDKQQFMDAISEQFTSMFMQFGAAELTAESFEEHVNSKAVHEYFAMLELDTSDAWMLFQLLDDDGSGTIDVEEFVDGCLRLKGAARSIDLAKLNKEIKMNHQRVGEDLSKMEVQLRDVRSAVDKQGKQDTVSATRGSTPLRLHTDSGGQQANGQRSQERTTDVGRLHRQEDELFASPSLPGVVWPVVDLTTDGKPCY
eukprot:TRINITY_DN1881_c0_g3_i1.p1 TRINITY_DN1881_c0_g3~~TRINITY_DN1881_c0_g3_i1.p1  ORF type:complete len:651 (+),score=91.11 TRINITY_DN1881_c0_g3_i1:48-2000(+)